LELHKEDLEPFVELEEFAICGSNFEYIAKDLFKYNKKLKYVWLSTNKISYIDPKVFDNLPDLVRLNLNSNICVNEDAKTREAVVELITKLKEKCSDPSTVVHVNVNILKTLQKKSDQKISSLEQNQVNSQKNYEKALQDINKRFDEFNEKFDRTINELRAEKLSATPERESKSVDETLMTKNISLFIVIPIICLTTVLNVILVIACVRKRINLSYAENNIESDNEIIL
jgi:hypothetical protein